MNRYFYTLRSSLKIAKEILLLTLLSYKDQIEKIKNKSKVFVSILTFLSTYFDSRSIY